jgi:protein-tyrosine-phosphatase
MVAEPIDPQTIQFLASRGIDASHQRSKALDEIPARDEFQLVVALDRAAQKALPQRPAKALGIDWYVPNPLKTHGTPDVVAAAYRAAFDSLTDHIRDLRQAILDDPIHEQPSK